MQIEHEVTRAEFVQAVKAFKRSHGKKLKELLNPNHPDAVKEFWSNLIIRAYLARSNIAFIDKHPDLKDSTHKDEHEHTDHYELKIYKYLPKDVFYRNEFVAQPQFYIKGTHTQEEAFDKILKAQCFQHDDINIKTGVDIYEIVENIVSYRTSDQKIRARFLVYEQSKDAHATTFISIMNPETGSMLASIFVNSWNQKTYYNYINERYGMEHSLFRKFMPDSLKQILKAKGSEVEVNRSEKYAVIYHGPDVKEQSEQFRELSDIDMVYIIDPGYSSRFILTSPLIDASHHLQLEEDDLNCALYSLNFIKAITQMLTDPAIADRIYRLAESVKKDPAAAQELTHIFQEELKQFLPQYYDQETKEPRTAAELEEFHLKQRWLMGALSISLQHPEDTTALSKDFKDRMQEGMIAEDTPSTGLKK